MPTEVDACNGDSEGFKDKRKSEEHLRLSRTLLGEDDDERPRYRHYGRQKQYVAPLHKMGYGL